MNWSIIVPLLIIAAGSAGWIFVFQWQVKSISDQQKVTLVNLSKVTFMGLLIWIPSTIGIVYGMVALYNDFGKQWLTPYLIFNVAYFAALFLVTFVYLGQVPKAGEITGFVLVFAGAVVSYFWR